jgi:putative glutamine amidotransferase
MQVLNVALGGTLIQHVPDVVGHGEHRRNVGTFVDNEHLVLLEPGSLAAESAGEAPEHRVLSHHHQAIDRVGEGLIVTGRSALDDLAEAIESPEHGYVLGVQWHPESDPSSQVVASLVEQAAAFMSERRPATPF